MFTISFVNSYGNCYEFMEESSSGQIKFEAKKYVGLEWHPKAKELFYQEKVAEEMVKDDSMDSTEPPKKQRVDLKECLKLYTSQVSFGILYDALV